MRWRFALERVIFVARLSASLPLKPVALATNPEPMADSLKTAEMADAFGSAAAREAERKDTLTLTELRLFLDAEGLSPYITRESGLSFDKQIRAYREAYADGALGFDLDLDAIRIRRAVLPAVANAIRRRVISGIVIEAFPQAPPAPATISKWSQGSRCNTDELSIIDFALLHFLARGGKVTEPSSAFETSRAIRFDLEHADAVSNAFREMRNGCDPDDSEASGHRRYVNVAGSVRPQPTLASVIGREPRLSFVFIGREAPKTDLRHILRDSVTLATPLAFLALNMAFCEPSDPTTYFGSYTFEVLAAVTSCGPAAATSSWSGLDVFVPRPSVRTFRARAYLRAY